MRRLVAAAAFLLAALGAPLSAQASTVQASDNIAQLNAAPGETNNVTLSQAGNVLTFADSTAPITPTAPECTAVTANIAKCTLKTVALAGIMLDDGNDSATIDQSVVVPAGLQIVGGEGADHLTGGVNTSNILIGDNTFGGGAADVLTGGDHADAFVGGEGSDVYNGGAGNDQALLVFGPDSGADTFNGGPGFDLISYQTETDPVNVSLDGAANDGVGCPGPACEGDNVMPDVEGVGGGTGDDTLTGTDAANELFGQEGDDTVSGGGGNDVLDGSSGQDHLDGGDGDDDLDPGSGADVASGGGGADVMQASERFGEPDVYSGGPGTDFLDYSDSVVGVSVSLDGKANDGGPGEGDSAGRDIEDVAGTVASDVLLGSGSANELTGGGGADRIGGGAGADGLIGEAGADRITGGKGRDLLEGDSGADRINSRDGKADEVRCGSSTDQVKADRSDRTSADCDRVKRKGKKR